MQETIWDDGTDKQLKLIYDYMGWCEDCKKCNPEHHNNREQCRWLNSNFAWECVQEMERRGDWEKFYFNTHNLCDEVTQLNHASFQLWLMNPANFFNCMAVWLERREK